MNQRKTLPKYLSTASFHWSVIPELKLYRDTGSDQGRPDKERDPAVMKSLINYRREEGWQCFPRIKKTHRAEENIPKDIRTDHGRDDLDRRRLEHADQDTGEDRDHKCDQADRQELLPVGTSGKP